jgi:hypothetical protein
MVGIDLGTTNMAVFYVDTYAVEPVIVSFAIPQLIAAGEVDDQPLLPSFCYLPGQAELPEDATLLPWDADTDHVVGRFARDQGAVVPERLIASAKSWLAHAGIDRSKPILPWGSELGHQARSPVAVTANYLDHIRRAWNHRFENQRDDDGTPCRLEDQQVIVTIPASFDETARELTITAARKAGFRQLALLEEPLAAFYAWLNRHEDDWQQWIEADQKILIVDVGGGTTDFSLVALDENGGLHRYAVGDHLLLGGDNIDIALAHKVEAQWSTKLAGAEWSQLCQLCRRAKEELLESSAESTDVTLLSRGSSVLQNMRKATIERSQVLDLLETGFYPDVPADSPPLPKRSGIRAMGLPYATEPSVTKHLLEFLRYAHRLTEPADAAGGIVYPWRILFNGGSMIAPFVRERVLSTVSSWFDGKSVEELPGEDYSLAVAIGAAYYGRVRQGSGVRVRGGLARSYYLETDHSAGDKSAVCIISRDTDEATAIEVPRQFKLQTNRKVLFNLYSSATRLLDAPGDLITDHAELSLVAPLVSVLQYGKNKVQEIDVTISSELTEVGALEVSLHSGASDHRWPLRFDLRLLAGLESLDASAPMQLIDESTMHRAMDAVTAAFNGPADKLPKLPGLLEEIVELPRSDWSILFLRDLADVLLDLEPTRERSADHEMRWLNLLGYCLRPGFGDVADELRLRRVWQLWFQGPNSGKPQVAAEWWVFWRRLAAGLRSGQQQTVFSTGAKLIFPKHTYRDSIREGEQTRQEIWRCLGALELVPPKKKQSTGQLLLNRGSELQAFEYWVLARLGARRPFQASEDVILPASDAVDWLRALTEITGSGQHEQMRQFTISRIAAGTGDRRLDIDSATLDSVRQHLQSVGAPAHWLDLLEVRTLETAEDQTKILGDSLPLGLTLVN